MCRIFLHCWHNQFCHYTRKAPNYADFVSYGNHKKLCKIIDSCRIMQKLPIKMPTLMELIILQAVVHIVLVEGSDNC